MKVICGCEYKDYSMQLFEVKKNIISMGNRIITNDYNYSTSDKIEDVIVGKESIVYTKKDNRGLLRTFFYTGDINSDELSEALKLLDRKGYLLEYICKGQNVLEPIFVNGGFKKLATRVRKISNLKLEGNQLRRLHSELMDQYYDESIGEYAKEEDAEEIEDVLLHVFDEKLDHIPTVTELKEMAKNKSILYFRFKGRIAALHIYQVIGKKLYTIFSYNSLNAIVLYSLEKRAHDYVVDNYGVICKYSWIDVTNEKSLKRNTYRNDDVHNYIYYNG